MTHRYFPFLIVAAAATAAVVLTPDGQEPLTPRAIEYRPMAVLGEAAYAEVTTPDPVAAVEPDSPVAETAFGTDGQDVEVFQMKGPAQPRRSHDISDPIPVEVTDRATRPDVAQIGEPIDANASVSGSFDAQEPMPILIGLTLDANETDVRYLPRPSTEVIEIGTQLDADSPWPDQNQEREPVDIGLPIETEGLGTLL